MRTGPYDGRRLREHEGLDALDALVLGEDVFSVVFECLAVVLERALDLALVVGVFLVEAEVVDAWSRTGSQAHASLPHEVVARQRTIRDLVERDRAGAARGSDAGAAPGALERRQARARLRGRLGVAGGVHLILTNTNIFCGGRGVQHGSG